MTHLRLWLPISSITFNKIQVLPMTHKALRDLVLPISLISTPTTLSLLPAILGFLLFLKCAKHTPFLENLLMLVFLLEHSPRYPLYIQAFTKIHLIQEVKLNQSLQHK